MAGDELGELIAFLAHTNPQVRLQAAQLVQGLTGSPEGLSQLAACAVTLLPPLLRLVPDTQPAIARSALTSLVNLCQEPAAQAQLLSLGAVGRCVDHIREGEHPQADLAVMLLANLTLPEEGAAALLQLGRGPAEGLHMAVLLKHFLEPLPAPHGAAAAAGAGAGPTPGDDYEHVASVLTNVTRLEAGRRLLLQPGRGLLAALASQLRSPNELRRRGAAAALKNCCFSCEADGTAEDIAAEDEALGIVLGALCGVPEPEPDAAVREALAEAVLCLARHDGARKHLWKLHAAELLGKGYELEESPTVCSCMEATAELFLQDGFSPGPQEGAGSDAPAAAAESAAGSAAQQQQQQQQGESGGEALPLPHIVEID